MDTTEHGSMDLNREGGLPPGNEPKEGKGPGPAIRPLIPVEPRGSRRTGKDKFARHEPQREDGSSKKAKDEQRSENAEDRIPDHMDEWLDKIKRTLGLEKSFDVQVRDMTFGGCRTGLLFLSSFAKDTALTEILKRLSYLTPDDINHDALESFLKFYVPSIQIRKGESFTEMINDVLMGNAAFYVDGEPKVLLLDAKQYPGRQPEQPELEKVVRGSKDGFTESILTNVGLIRRRLRDPQLRFEITKVGERTQTDVAIAYIDDIADTKLVESVRDKIKAVKVDGIPLADKQLEEVTVKTGWHPFPLVRYSERPDVVASHLLDGSVTVLVDTSPSVMMLPTTYFDLIQHAEENRQNPFIGSYLRWIRFFGILASMFLMPLWYMYAESPELRPQWLWFLGADKTGDLPLVIQFLLVEIGVDLMRLAAVHTPTPLVTAMSLVSAILIGDIAVKTGLFINEVILYMAVAAIGTFATPSYELGLANRIVRLVLLFAVYLFQLPGFVAGATLMLIGLVMIRSYNTPYMWPFIPFNGPAMLSVLLRKPLPKSRLRPSIYRTKQSDKQPV
ncbi:spore germination protein [Cohnella sp. JJ-181]|uniref:spore germination protein n=1 Tax=Cohnella rhizoplanae TaxID=2974897 RepID=UPI0022FF679F|nr:spore germination protein [Cohnella sp. JJ-181]CAI6057179.1 Spore germination protein XA [Cohnella sp. JJ-181]